MPKGIWRPRAERLPRDEYLNRAYEFAHRKNGKLSVDQVALIRQRAASGEPKKPMAAEFGVHPNTIYRICDHTNYLA